MELKRREAVKPLGCHTVIGHLHELKKWKEIPYLYKNEGMLPPFIIAVGSRVRVAKACDILELRRPVLIDEEARKKFGLDAYGRISLLVGIFEKKGIELPLGIVETQMGCSATQINLKETLYFARDDGYSLGKRFVKSDGIYVIRVGTCAGVNSRSPAEVATKIGDILIATESYGSIGAIFQSTLKELNFTGINVSEKIDALRRMMSEYRVLRLSHDFKNINTTCSTRLVLQLQWAADALRTKNLVGPNFTKDSLYAEIGEEGFAMLRDTYGIVSTEMEEPMIDVLAAEFRRIGIPVYSGLISAAVGAIPGKSFPETEEEKDAAEKAEENALKIAANALSRIAKGLNKKI